MITTLVCLILATLLSYTIWALNPVKTSMSVLTLSLSMFFLMGYKSGLSWLPLLMLMLFMGGIILMFMILSSILPNEKSMKIKSQPLLMASVLLLSLCTEHSFNSTPMSAEVKSFLISGTNFYFMMLIILIYFTGSLATLSNTQTPMRTLPCCSNLIL